jgi:hypothetical protein
MASLEPGNLLGDRYRIVDRLGQGGMGVVYRAFDAKLDREVAVKVVAPEDVGDAGLRARLIREARTAAKVVHPGIVHVYDVGETSDGGVFVILELVDGASLRQSLGEAALSLTDRLRILAECARALEAAHSAGVVHRDIKPDNVMVRTNGRAVLLDFGLAKPRQLATPSGVHQATEPALTRHGAIAGTPAYLAPEQARGEDLDGRADQFALGVTAYEVLTGRIPWRGVDATALIASMLVDEPAPPSTIVTDLPRELDAIVLRALSKKREQRFPDCGALAEALERVARGERSGPDVVVRPNSGDAAQLAGTERALEVATPLLAPVRSRKGRAVATAAAVLAFAATIAGTVAIRRSRSVHTTQQGAPQAPATRLPLACPILEARVDGQPAPWLGAAAGSALCRHLTMLLGGASQTTLVPAELLALPRTPKDDAGLSPYEDKGSRPRTLDSAKARAGAIIDGEVDASEQEVRLALVLRTKDGTELGRVSQSGPTLAAAAEGAGRPILAALGIPVATVVSPEVKDVLGVDDPNLLEWLEELYSFFEEMEAPQPELCARLAPRAAELGPHAAFVARTCRVELPAPRAGASLSARALAEARATRPEVDITTLEAAVPGTSGLRRAVLSSTLARRRRGESAAFDAAVDALQADPRWALGWDVLITATDAPYPATRSMVGWLPDVSMGWVYLGKNYDAFDAAARLSLMRRGWLLEPSAMTGQNVGKALLEDGRPAEAQAVAARLASSSNNEMGRGVARMLRVRIALSQTQPDAAYTQSLAAIAAMTTFGLGLRGDMILLHAARDAALITGRERQLADEIAQRYVLAEPPRIESHGNGLLVMAGACAFGSPEVAGKCIARLKALDAATPLARSSGTLELLDCAASHVVGDRAAAVAACRRFLAAGSIQVNRQTALLSTVFDLGGEQDLAERLDVAALAAAPEYGGATLAHVRCARRAAKRGDARRARELAETVVRAWSSADTKLAVVDEMRALLARLPADAKP